MRLVGREWTYSDDEDECRSEEGIRAGAAMRAAQTCLVAHFRVRRGLKPWGIQQNLDLGDMVAVVWMLGVILQDMVTLFPDEAHEDLVKVLLEDVETILRAMARAMDVPVSEVVSEYFLQLATEDYP